MTTRIPNNLREYRQKLGMRQIDVAKALDVDCLDRISKWENGLAVPSIVNLFKLAALYQVDPRELYQSVYQSMTEKKSGHVTTIAESAPSA